MTFAIHVPPAHHQRATLAVWHKLRALEGLLLGFCRNDSANENWLSRLAVKFPAIDK